jgi:hypothetical protein
MPWDWVECGVKVVVRKGKLKTKWYRRVIKMKRPKPKPC